MDNETKTKIICPKCAGLNLGQVCIINPNELTEDSLEILELWDVWHCFDCEEDVEAEEVMIN